MSLSRDSVLFPSEQYIQECIKYQKKLREEWEPRPGDWFLYPIGNGEYGVSVLGSYCMRDGWTQLPGHIPLFQPRQIIEMLEERGKAWRHGVIDPLYEPIWITEGIIGKGEHYWASMRPELGDKKRIICYGPDPATALLRAYLEVMKEE